MKLEFGKVKIPIASYEGNKCIFFGKARCVSFDRDLRNEEKKKPVQQRCTGYNKLCPQYIGVSPFTPAYDEKYILPKFETEVLTTALLESANILIVGPPATGKSSIVRQVASILNWGLIGFSCGEETSIAKIIGQWVVQGQEMKWADGYVTTAMRNGLVLLEDEADFMRPELRGEMHGIMESGGTLTLSAIHPGTRQPYQEVIHKHPLFRWVSTANTTGHGDDSFSYHGTNYFNAASRDRYEMILSIGYRSEDQELEILKAKTDLDELTIRQMISVATECRKKTINQELMFQFTLRRLLAWGKYWKKLGGEDSAKLTILNFANDVDRHTLASLIKTHIGLNVD
jgi:cobaltochelatase CobS